MEFLHSRFMAITISALFLIFFSNSSSPIISVSPPLSISDFPLHFVSDSPLVSVSDSSPLHSLLRLQFHTAETNPGTGAESKTNSPTHTCGAHGDAGGCFMGLNKECWLGDDGL